MLTNRVVGRTYIKANNVRRFGHEFRIGALTPRLAARQINLLRPQETPDILFMDIEQFTSQQRRRPVGIACGWSLIQHREDAPPVLRPVSWLGTTIAGFTQTRHSLARITHAPLRRGARRAANFPRNGAGARTRCCQQHNAGPISHTGLALTRASQRADSGGS